MHCSHARFVWNLALEQANGWRPGRAASPSSGERFRQLAEARRGSWLGEGSSSVQQQALRDFDRALREWWAGSHRRPRWRKQGVDEGFCVRDVKVRRISRKWAEMHVPKCGPIRFRLTRPLGAHGMARVTLDRAGRWHVSFAAPQPPVPRAPIRAVVGIDLGVAHTVTTSDGVHLNIPTLRPSEERRGREGRPQSRHRRLGLGRPSSPHQPESNGLPRVRSGLRRPEEHQPGMLCLRPHRRGEPAQSGLVSLRSLRSHRTRRRQRGQEHLRPGAPGACAWREARSWGALRSANHRRGGGVNTPLKGIPTASAVGGGQEGASR
jgi:hypothetical protein